MEEALRKRRSVRSFSPGRLIPAATITKIVDSGRLAPSARNVQPWEFVVVTERKKLRALAALADNGKFLGESSCCIAVFCRETKYYLEDGCAATENMLLAACGLGIDSCWVAGDKKPYAEEVRISLSVPEGFKLVSLIALGYGSQQVYQPPKRPLDEVLHWGTYGSRVPAEKESGKTKA